MSRVIIIGLIGAMLLSGCGRLLGQPAASSPPPLETAQGQQPRVPQLPSGRWLGTQFEDVPVPPDFTLDYDSSYVSVSEQGPRVSDLRYTGTTALTDVLRFVQQAMPQAGWQLASLAGVAIKSLRYYKEDEECQLVIHKGDEGGTVIMVRLHPR